CRPDAVAALSHSRPAAIDRHRNNWCLRRERHDEPTFLERQHLAGWRSRAFRKDEKAVPGAKRFGPARDRRHRLLPVPANYRNEAARQEDATEQRHLQELGLEEDVEPTMEGGEQDRRVDVALMIGAEDDRAVARHTIEARHRASNPRQEQPQVEAAMAEDVEDVAPAERKGQKQAWRRSEQNVEGDTDVSGERSDGGDERHPERSS